MTMVAALTHAEQLLALRVRFHEIRAVKHLEAIDAHRLEELLTEIRQQPSGPERDKLLDEVLEFWQAVRTLQDIIAQTNQQQQVPS